MELADIEVPLRGTFIIGKMLKLKTDKAVVYRGLNHVTSVDVKIQRVCPGVGQIDCIECDGSGVWPYYPNGLEPTQCVECKGTGKVYVSFY